MTDSSLLRDYIGNNSFLWNDFLRNELLSDDVISFLVSVMHLSGKTASESVLVFLASLRYISNDYTIASGFGKSLEIKPFLSGNYDELIRLCCTKKVQANFPERGLPVMEMISLQKPLKDVFVIELGASYGLIGKLLLNMPDIITKTNNYFTDKQQFPVSWLSISSYLGIELDPPDEKWLLACTPDDQHLIRLKQFIEDYRNTENFLLLKGSAFDLEDIIAENKIDCLKVTPIILTSFMTYQLSKSQNDELESVINSFCLKYDGVWLDQMVRIASAGHDDAYFIRKDGIAYVKLDSDRCENWEFL